jgi:hypothetical protein
VVTFSPSPAGLPIYASLNWNALITLANRGVTATGSTYDPATGQVSTTFSYSAPISGQLEVDVNTTADPRVSAADFNLSLAAVTDNNEALAYYPPSDYAAASIVKYLALGLGACALLLILAAAFGGRLVSLECAGVIQLACISILSLENLSPEFSALEALWLSLGYNSLQSYNLQQPVGRPFKSALLSESFLLNYNIVGALCLLPLISWSVCKLVARRVAKEDAERWEQRARHCLGEYVLYLFLAFSYLAYLSLFIELRYMSAGTPDYMGLAVGVLVTIAGVVYAVVYCRADSYLLEFRSKFTPDAFGRKFYLFFMAERLLAPAALVMLASQPYSNAVVLAVYLVLLIVILKAQPYVGERKNWRPVANCLIVMVIEGVYLGTGFMSNPTSMLATYGPLVILGLLAVCVVYSVYALVQELRENCSACQK